MTEEEVNSIKQLSHEAGRAEMAELVEAQKEYIELLSKAERFLITMGAIHGWKADDKDVERGKELRATIAELSQPPTNDKP